MVIIMALDDDYIDVLDMDDDSDALSSWLDDDYDALDVDKW